MGENESIGFNRKRAEGRYKDTRKTLKLKVRKLNPINTIAYAQILGTGMDTQDTSPSVMLFFDKQRFIFNAGEGLQRFCTEHKIKLSKIDHIFLSRVCSETAGGLPDFQYLVDAMKSFIPNAAIVHTRSFGSGPSSDGDDMHTRRKLGDPIVLIDDEVVNVSAILLQPTCSDDNELMQEEAIVPELALKLGDFSVIYVCELPEIKGKFVPKKAEALGLKPGPKYCELQLGNSVKSDHQDIMVHPSDVLGPSIPCPILLLLDCPISSHMRQLLSMQSLNSYYKYTCSKPTKSFKTVNCVIHLSPASVLDDSNYQMWMSRFGEAQHIMAGYKKKNIEIPILKASARVSAQLNYLCPQFFPDPGFWSLQNLGCSASDSKVENEDSVAKKFNYSISAENLLKAFGVALRAADRVNSVRKSIPGWKIVYSGDTRPCPELVKVSHKATVLIHEATFEDGMGEEAIGKNHSTTEEAIEVGECAEVYRIILTHFSQRYPKIPAFDENHMDKTCIAFDLMSVNLADLHMLPKVIPYLKLLFRNELIPDEVDGDETITTEDVYN